VTGIEMSSSFLSELGMCMYRQVERAASQCHSILMLTGGASRQGSLSVARKDISITNHHGPDRVMSCHVMAEVILLSGNRETKVIPLLGNRRDDIGPTAFPEAPFQSPIVLTVPGG